MATEPSSLRWRRAVRYNLIVRFATLLTILLLSASTALAAPTTKPTKALNSKSIAAVDAAIRALSREWSAAQSGSKVKLRQTCNYFKDNRSDDVTADAILAALERGMRDDTPQAYY